MLPSSAIVFFSNLFVCLPCCSSPPTEGGYIRQGSEPAVEQGLHGVQLLPKPRDHPRTGSYTSISCSCKSQLTPPPLRSQGFPWQWYYGIFFQGVRRGELGSNWSPPKCGRYLDVGLLVHRKTSARIRRPVRRSQADLFKCLTLLRLSNPL